MSQAQRALDRVARIRTQFGHLKVDLQDIKLPTPRSHEHTAYHDLAQLLEAADEVMAYYAQCIEVYIGPRP